MPNFFSFQQGDDEHAPRYNPDASPLLGRFRAVPRAATGSTGGGGGNIFGQAQRLYQQQQRRQGGGSGSGGRNSPAAGLLPTLGASNPRGSVHVGYGTLLAAQLMASAAGDSDDEDEEEEEEEEDEEEDDISDDDVDSDGGGAGGGGGGGGFRGFLGGVRSSGSRGGGGGGGGGGLVGRRRRRQLGRTLRRTWRRLDALWISPRQGRVRRVVEKWWTRWSLLVVLPALLAVAWCAVPFPKYPLPGDGDDDDTGGDPSHGGPERPPPSQKMPGHGATRVQINFWFFLFVFYGFYNLTALGAWITKVFNIYCLNWWPQSLGFPVTVTAIALFSILAPIPIYLIPETRWITVHNTAWITWTFCLMAMPVAIAFLILMTNERHLSLRHSLSETQRIFTTSWWTGEPDTISASSSRRRPQLPLGDPDIDALQVVDHHGGHARGSRAARSGPSLPVRLRRRWLPASFVRFIWFCLALSIGLLAYVIGEAYAEIYLRTLPHNNLETIVYVYGWITTVYLLDGLTGWILGGNEGERVGSYPLSWIFKLYFMLTYQTYVRALYARLRSPSQFILLQILSSTTLIIITPLTMSATFHWLLTVLGLNGQTYGSYQKVGVRNVFIRFLAENASMLAFLGSVVVLHFGPNKDVYPYFAFDDDRERYNFRLTLTASSVTWACEMAASFIVAGLIRWIYGVSVVTEGKMDLAVWPELLPTSVAVVLHVLQNMLFSIIRLQFH